MELDFSVDIPIHIAVLITVYIYHIWYIYEPYFILCHTERKLAVTSLKSYNINMPMPVTSETTSALCRV